MAANGSVTVANTGGWYLSLRRPPGTPPSQVFGPVGFTLYICIGVAAWLVWRRVEVAVHRKRAALRSWGWQLLANALWPPAFFGMHALGLALCVVLLLAGAIVVTTVRFHPIDWRAAWLLAPYLVWVGFALYLNAGFWWLNTG